MFNIGQGAAHYTVAQQRIFKTLSGITYNDYKCSALCFVRTPSTPVCDFYILDSGVCYLGSLFESTSTSLPANTFTAIYNNSKYDSL
jgi:hypothetical protein